MSNRRNVVAVVDDDPGMLDAMKHLLSAYEYDTELYASAKAFIDVAATSEAACLIVDIQLGCVSGIDLARLLAEAEFKFPIIFMTASDDGMIRQQAMKAGCVAYLHKPFSPHLLIEALVEVERQSRQSPSDARDRKSPCRDTDSG